MPYTYKDFKEVAYDTVGFVLAIAGTLFLLTM